MNAKNKLALVVMLFPAVFALVCLGRWLWFYRGNYSAPEIPEIDVSQVIPPSVEYRSFAETPVARAGHVVIDLAHKNNLEVNDLALLRDRLVARGALVEIYDGADGELAKRLHSATALLVLAPTVKFTSEEQELVADFVADGGRLLIAADPTRPVPQENEEESPSLYDVLFPTSAVPAVNSLANRFGVVFFDDYLYNLEENEGNYRNVRFTIFAERQPLTRGVKQVVFFAAHSLRGDGVPLIVGDAHTRSPVRSGESDLAAAMLTADGRVLALGDITFLTAPYHAIGDNDRFLNRIADWLAVDSRQRNELDDFPYFFEQSVSLVQVGGGFLFPQLIAESGAMRAFFEEAGYTLTIRATPAPGDDVLFVGLFDDADAVQEYLVAAGVVITQTEETEGSSEATEGGVTEETEETECTAPSIIHITGLGDVGFKGMTLYLLIPGDERVTLIMLAENDEALMAAGRRLMEHDLSGCTQTGMVTLCSTGEEQQGLKEEPAAEEKHSGRIFILADDKRSEGKRTSLPEFEAILSETYDVTTWSIATDGVPEADDLAGYDVYIIDSGDYAFDIENAKGLTILESLEARAIMLVGEQSLPLLGGETEPIQDLQVADVAHPLAAGFEAGETLELLASESGVPAMVLSADDLDEEAEVILKRGPDSPAAGTPALVANMDEGGEIERVIVAAFSFYRLPEEARRTLTLNAVAWLMEAGRE